MFFGKDSGIRAQEPPTNMLVAMGIAAALCIGIGVFPGPLYRLLPFPVEFHPYTGEHVTNSLGMLMFTGLGFFMLLKKLDPEATISVDTDWFYRMGSRIFMWIAKNPLAVVETYWSNVYNTWFSAGFIKVANFLGRFFDRAVIDGFVNGVAAFFMASSHTLSRPQNGLIRNYAFVMLLGCMLFMGYYLIATQM